jgi:ribonuclease-3
LKLFQAVKYSFSKEKSLAFNVKNLTGSFPGNINLYKQAFRHKSVSYEIFNGSRVSNERLEYLGDAVLSLVVADYLFRKYPFKDEGYLTLMRSKIVSRANLNKLSEKLGIDKMIMHDSDSSSVYRSIKGDAFEAFIGAVYIDKGYRSTYKIIINRIISCHIDTDELENKDLNFKSKLLEWAQKEKKTHDYKVVGEEGKGYLKNYIVIAYINSKECGKGKGHSIKEAEQSAAEQACIMLGI